VRLALTEKGRRQLESLSEQHLDELTHLAPTMRTLWAAVEHVSGEDARRTRDASS
jgi:hypothetical protein